MHLRLFALCLLGFALSTSAVQAHGCTPRDFIEAYRQASAASARKDVAAAIARFRALAEQGLGPAQARLGQLLSDAPGSDLIEAHLWTALAADIGTPGTDDTLSLIEARLTGPQLEQSKSTHRGWQPKLGPCLSVDPRLPRADGLFGYNLDLLIGRVLVPRSMSDAKVKHAKWWLASNLELVRVKNPRFLIYFKALYGVAFVGDGPFVVIDSREDLPLLMINEGFTDGVTEERLRDMVTAAVTAVTTSLMPPIKAAAPETYKGRIIRSISTPDGRRFVDAMKQAIDLAERLPHELSELARSLSDLRYEPRRAFDRRGTAMGLGEYSHDAASGQGYMSYGENFEYRGPSSLTISLVHGGIFVRRDNALANAKRSLADARKRNVTADITKAQLQVGDIEKLVTPGLDPTVYLRGECELEDYEIKTMEALKLDTITINRKYKARSSRGCG